MKKIDVINEIERLKTNQAEFEKRFCENNQGNFQAIQQRKHESMVYQAALNELLYAIKKYKD